MIRWSYYHKDLWTCRLNIYDEFGNRIYREWEVSSPALSIILEVLSDYGFALEINGTDKVFNMNGLSEEDQIDLRVASLHKLEDIDG